MPARWRVGRKVGRTLYEQVGDAPSDDDWLIGMMDTPELARAVVEARDALRFAELDLAVALREQLENGLPVKTWHELARDVLSRALAASGGYPEEGKDG